MELILASGSPRRKQLLTELGFNFRVQAVNIDEGLPSSLAARKAALFLAHKKGLAAKKISRNHSWILSADSVVILNDTVLGKPIDRQDAIKTLLSLSNQVHQVHTAFYITNQRKEWAQRVVSTVYMDKISLAEAEYYVDHFEPYDKAGSYAIQEWIGYCKVKKIEGSYTNIVGLPTHEVYQAFTKLGYLEDTGDLN